MEMLVLILGLGRYYADWIAATQVPTAAEIDKHSIKSLQLTRSCGRHWPLLIYSYVLGGVLMLSLKSEPVEVLCVKAFVSPGKVIVAKT